MPRFDPEPRDHVAFRVGQRDFSFEVVEHPNAPDQVHAMEGGKATVFHLREQRAPHSEYALKVMKKQYMDPMLVAVCASLDFLKQRAGLRVCERTCLSPQTARDVIQQFPTLQYSILMPWIRKLSWFDVLQKARDGATAFTPGTSLRLALNLLDVLGRLEQDGLAHCDLSAANLMLDSASYQIDLIDVEDIYMPSLQPPNAVPAGTPGYQHVTSGQGQWGRFADRFAGAILLSEVLGWYDDKVRAACFGDSYFDPGEMQKPGGRRFAILKDAVAVHSKGMAALLEKAWNSLTLEQCPSFSDWRQASPFPFAPPEPARAPVAWQPSQPTQSAPPVSWATIQPANPAGAPIFWENG